MRRLPLVVAALLLAVVSVPVVGVAPAQAQGLPHTTCTTSTDFLSIHFTPGLDLFPELVEFSQGGAIPSAQCLASGQNGFAGSVEITDVEGSSINSCLSSSDASGTATLLWSDDETSTVEITDIASGLGSVALLVTLKGSVQDGKFIGDGLTIVLAAAFVNVFGCLFADGLTDFAGTVTAIFTTP